MQSPSNADTLTPGTPIHISTAPLTLEAAQSILELTMSTRGSANCEPVSIPLTAHPKVKEGYDQCMKCGIFGHRTWECAQFATTAKPISDWRRTKNGKIYSVKALLGMHPYHKWTIDTVVEEHSSPQTFQPVSKPSNDLQTDFHTPPDVLKTASINSSPARTRTKVINDYKSETTKTLEIDDLMTSTPTPPATTSSPTKKPKRSSRSKPNWSRVWSTLTCVDAAAIIEGVASRRRITANVGRARPTEGCFTRKSLFTSCF
ncbi:hypothetical protein DFH28DRAFT_1084204 [Melampsora americana]|nr:hypothetical protein DFH28DRAFT_1084204 [Melampsora americana]